MYMLNNSVVVVIPIYKQSPDVHETASFRQCLNLLRNYHVVIVTYEELNCSLYSKIAKDYNRELFFEYFDKTCFTSIDGYNKLCLSKELYERFLLYEYMLIFQLDAWIFRDELLYWCSMKYDYIGAPLFKIVNGQYTYDLSGFIGNGGLSLRKISFCLRALNYKRYKPILTWKYLLKTSNSVFDMLKVPIKLIGIHNNKSWFLMKEDYPCIHEDHYFSLFKYSYMKCHFPDFNEALRFSFEVHPSYMYELNQKKLPFGCHAFMKYEYATFWSHYIKIPTCESEIKDNNRE